METGLVSLPDGDDSTLKPSFEGWKRTVLDILVPPQHPLKPSFEGWKLKDGDPWWVAKDVL